MMLCCRSELETLVYRKEIGCVPVGTGFEVGVVVVGVKKLVVARCPRVE